MYQRIGKRIFDVIGALMLLCFLFPIIGVAALLVGFKLGSPVLFRQDRPGLDGEIFRMMKFRTMTDSRDEQGELRSDSKRLTRLGKFLRSSSLDELPGLLNVLRGEMSLVGPRPLLPQYLARYSSEQARRHTVRPGITGWAQVNGRNAISWDEKFRYDVWYVDNLSFALDLKILFLTVWKVFRRDGISAEGEATMTEFMGNGENVQRPTSNFQHPTGETGK